jgi:hypothetical protein
LEPAGPFASMKCGFPASVTRPFPNSSTSL